MVDKHDWHSEGEPKKGSTIKWEATDGTKSNEPKLAVHLVNGIPLADCTIILRRDPKDARSKVASKEYDFWGFKRISYNNDRDSFRASDLVNDFISKAIEKFKRDSNPRKQESPDEFTYADVVQFTTPKFGDRICERESPCDYVAAVQEMIDAGLKRIVFRITTTKVDKKSPGQGNKRKLESQPQRIQSKIQKTGTDDIAAERQDQLEEDIAFDAPVEGCRFVSSVDKWSNKEVTEAQRRQTVDQFQKLRDCHAIEQFDTKTWARCCLFFGVDVTKMQTPETFTIPGLKVPLKPYQAYAVFHMLSSESSISGGGFLADEDGLGREHEVLALFVVNHILAQTAWVVRSDISKAHLPQAGKAGGKSQSEEAECPSEAVGEPRFPIRCPCVRNGISASLVSSKRDGPTLLLVPESSIQHWVAMIDKYIDTSAVVISYHAEAKALKTCVLSKATGVSKVDNETRQLMTTPGSRGGARRGHSRFLLLTSPAAWDECVIQEYSSPFPKQIFNLPWGRVVRDQWEKQMDKDSKTAIILNAITGKPYLRASSGTPFESRPADLAVFVDYLARNSDRVSWSGDSDLQWAIRLDLVDCHYKLLKIWGWPVFSVDLSKFIREFEHVLKGLTLRRTAKTKFLGMPIYVPPKLQRQVIECVTPGRVKDSIKQLRRQAQNILIKELESDEHDWAEDDFQGPLPVTSIQTWYSLARVFRMTATIPRLAKLAIDEDLSLTTEEFESNEWWKESGNSPYEQNINELGNSMKFEELYKLLEGLLKESARNKKAIVVSEYPVVAFITHLWLKSKGFLSVFMHKNTADPWGLIRDFECASDEEGYENSATIAQANVLVTTLKDMKRNFSLSHATKLILMERFWNEADEASLASHLTQPRQQELSTDYILYCQDSKTERNIARHRKGDLHFHHLSFIEEGDPIKFGESRSAIFSVFKNVLENGTSTLVEEIYPQNDELQTLRSLNGGDEWPDQAGVKLLTDFTGSFPQVRFLPEDFTNRQAQLWRREEKQKRMHALDQNTPGYEQRNWEKAAIAKLQTRIKTSQDSQKERNKIWMEQTKEEISRLQTEIDQTNFQASLEEESDETDTELENNLQETIAQQGREMTALRLRPRTAPADWEPRAPFRGPVDDEEKPKTKSKPPKTEPAPIPRPAKKGAKSAPRNRRKANSPANAANRWGVVNLNRSKNVQDILDPGPRPEGTPTKQIEKNRMFAWETRVRIGKLDAKIRNEDSSLRLWGREDNEDDIHRRSNANDKRKEDLLKLQGMRKVAPIGWKPDEELAREAKKKAEKEAGNDSYEGEDENTNENEKQGQDEAEIKDDSDEKEFWEIEALPIPDQLLLDEQADYDSDTEYNVRSQTNEDPNPLNRAWASPAAISRGKLWRARKKELYLDVVERQEENASNMSAEYWKNEIKKAKEAMNSPAPFGWIPKGYEIAEEKFSATGSHWEWEKPPNDPQDVGGPNWYLQPKKKEKPDYDGI